MSSVSTSSLSESSDFVEYSQAQSSTVSSGEHEEMRRKVYMRKKDRKASGNQHSSFKSVDDDKASSDSDTPPTNSSKSTSCSLTSCESSYGSCNSTLFSQVPSPIPSDSSSSHEYKSSYSSSDSSYLSSDDANEQSRPKDTSKTAGQKMMEEELASENLFNSNCIAEDIKLYNESNERKNQDHLENLKSN
ncbi:dentin sialophosphoprotein isoform X2 [Diachasma alloeum]|nr:dentin sialophosphoprotein isoform X2 [Diachasma alloeum]XP_015116830.1 dentin sialophosphoprotein isoform X2 [Diachasma alloeum]